jgi:hypothetical protein
MNNNKDSTAAGRRGAGITAAILASLLVPGAAWGQQPQSVLVDVGPCVNLVSPGERLDCYEEQVARARAQTPAPAQAAPAPSVTPPAVSVPAAARAQAAAPTPTPAVAAPRPPTPVGAVEPPVRVENARVENAPVASRRENRRVENARGASDLQFEGAITGLRETVPDAWIITLHNGQVWRQNFPKPYGLQVGQRVQISEGRLGNSYRLTVVGMGGFIQVEPVR